MTENALIMQQAPILRFFTSEAIFGIQLKQIQDVFLA
jgi:hypothetical protein